MSSAAILKHVSEKNSDYGAAQRYLFFEHDPVTGKVLRDEQGLMILREGIIHSGINCDPFTFNTECTELNRTRGKNQGRNDVKAHQYIISFDPRDASDNGLTPPKAHELGMEFARRFFDGHQTLVVTHPDGHNGAGNIHVHIVFNSLRKTNITWMPFMEKPADALAGFKHHQTRELLRNMQDFLNELCEREHLNTVDFSLPADRKVTDLEYKAEQQSGEDSIKDKLRSAIDKAAAGAYTAAEFKSILKRDFGIEIKETRGVWSYIHPERPRPIRARSLGRIYGREAIENRIAGIRDIDMSRPEYSKLPRIFLVKSDLRLVTDIQNNIKAKQSRVYARKVSLSNLQRTARAVAYIQQYGIDTQEMLNERLSALDAECRDIRMRMKDNNAEITDVNAEIHYLGQYLSGRKVYAEFLKAADKGSFRLGRREEIDRYESAAAYIKKCYPDSFPAMAELKSRRTRLMRERTALKSSYTAACGCKSRLQTSKRNIDALFAERVPPQLSRSAR